ncbi:MAG: L,D-transpeptidase [Chitinophagaceae bacterium]|nr:L,D-transpeptidase [Chitinophagaceae bacterium]
MKTFIQPFILIAMLSMLNSCNDASPFKLKKLDYKKIVRLLRGQKTKDAIKSDTSNFLDSQEFDPQQDSLADILKQFNLELKEDSLQIEKLGINDSGILHSNQGMDTNFSITKVDSFSENIKEINPEEIRTLKYNLLQSTQPDSMALSLEKKACYQKECMVWADIHKSTQKLYLYVNGEISDSFKVSTGDKQHETPLMDLRPSGPIFKKYTSKKFPGGNYQGLGNMPYVVFIRGGYGIHGTTTGNIPKLGHKASHGCIRLHPDNAKILNELVRQAGLQHTWITIRN